MEKYKVEFTKTAVKSLKVLPKTSQVQIISKIDELSEKPDSMQNVKKLVNYDISFRLRVGNYRVLFEKDDIIRIIEIIDIRHRKEAY